MSFLLVSSFLQTALRQRILDHGGGRESESESARQSGSGDTAQRATAPQNEQSAQLANN